MSAPAFIAKASAATGNGASQNQGHVSGIVAGDLLVIAAISYQEPGGSIGDIDTPAGWTLAGGGIFRNSSTTNVGTFKVFWKMATGSEAGSVSISRSGSNGGSNLFYTQMYQFRGTSINVTGAASKTDGDGSGVIQWNGVSVVGSEPTTIALIGQMENDPGTPSGYTNEASDSSGGIVAYLECNVKEVSTGATVTATMGSGSGWATVHISIFNALGRSFIVN